MKRKDGWRYLAHLLRLWRAEGKDSAVWPAARRARSVACIVFGNRLGAYEAPEREAIWWGLGQPLAEQLLRGEL